MPEHLRAFTGCLVPLDGRPGTVVGCFGSIGRRSLAVAPRPPEEVLETCSLVVLQVVQTSQLVPTVRATITKRRSPVTFVRRLKPGSSTLVTACRDGRSVATRPLPRQSAPLMGASVAAGREIVVGSILIVVRASLVAFTGALVVIGPRLILITRGLVAIRARLILVPLALAAINRRPGTG